MSDSPIASKSTMVQPRLLIIGAGSRGNSYARAVRDSGLGVIAGVVEPVTFKRERLGSTYIWHEQSKPSPEQQFDDWNDYLAYEKQRRKDEAAGLQVPAGIDGVFICVRDDLHISVVTALAPLGLHILCEKPLATTLDDCVRMQRVLQSFPERIFAIGHVLRYSPHNMLLRHLVLEQKAIGDVLSMEHTEPVGWWHFSHSYVRGQWRKEKTSAPSLLTKSCHDIDFILWMLCSPLDATRRPHLPSSVVSMGSLKQFVRKQKPKEAGSATNCIACPINDLCMYSAPRIYYDRHLSRGNTRWPVDIVNPEIPAIVEREGPQKAKEALFHTLSEDYDMERMTVEDIESRPWYGRCVWESDNDVCDDQIVTFTWEDDQNSGQTAKTATFHMVAQTLAQSSRRGRVYGTTGEISYDSESITIYDFINDTTKTWHPEVPKNSHHGGGDDGLTQQFLKAVAAVNSGSMGVKEAQREHLGVSFEEIVRSHAAVFAAEQARKESKVVGWEDWWATKVETIL